MRNPLVIAAILSVSLAACGPSGEPVPERLPDETTATVPGNVETLAAPDAASADDCATLSADGLCGLRFGMDEGEVRAAYPGEIHGDQPADSACFFLRPQEASYGQLFMMDGGTLERIDISIPGIATPQGAEVGMMLEAVEGLYEDTERLPNKYVPDYEDLRVTLGDGLFAVFEQGEGGIVQAYRVGRAPAVDYVEGCA